MLSPSPRPNHSGEVHPLLETHAAVPLTQQPPTSHRVSRWGVLAVTSTLLFGAAVFGVFKPSPSTLRSVTTVAPDAKFDLFTPIFNAEVPPESLFNHTDAHKTLLPPKYLAPGLVGSRPIPTNDWWGNMIGATAEEDVVYPVWTNPYSVTPSIYMEPFGLTMNYPFTTREFGGGLTGNGDAEMYYLHGQVPEFTFSATEFSNASHPVFEVFDWDDLSVQLRFMDRRDNSKKFEATLASGMAFVTVHYSGLTPRFQTVYNISTINGLDATESINRPLTNTRYVLQFDNGATWTLYFSTQVSLYFDGHSTLDMKQPFTGVSRVALIPDASAQEQKVFDDTASCVLNGGRVEAHNENAYAYKWQTSGDCATSGMLHYAQVHHIDTLDRRYAVEAEGVAAHSTTRGLMQGVVTKTSPPEWRMVETVDFPIDFYPPRKPDASVVANYEMKKNLIADIDSEWSIALGQSYYFNGKAAQKYASLCLMAGDASVVGADDTTLLPRCIKKLEGMLAPFLNNTWTNPLNYDTIYRGVVSSQGFTLHDPNVDFGNTMYNDHHYHYGYWVVTAAIINKLDPTWSGIPALNRMAGFLIRDVANPSDADPYFPKFRSLDWYRGHSYSHGITALGDGKDEESTSEDMNFYYGMTLLGKVTGDTHLETVGKLMVKLNARAIQTYFLLEDGNRAHPDRYRDNKVMGILFDNKVNYATWFSGEKYAIHGIQMLPATAVTEFVRTRDFVSQEWDQILSRESIVQNDEQTNPWLSLLYMNYATVNKEFALEKLRNVTMDDGLSRSWAMYIAATRP
ncbi:putative endo-1,3-beta-glucanase [Phytophthora sojae]|uniref:glucan endo-1,3-beta-D-glucosidase n=2 Tax=Phytophthora sojae (strain P6497) TaxID=1094619 RepID=G4ZF98_PHYSP|nr:putative endo-1,3-beta-glucanase [Phytophthora sojae]EGZ16601.1 putative endo-1,3-beta-glucanase [Phytophthora sojae]|eukprot:XP_009525659.1 putative endo-1,3-beta-glucanase [Phytophthora sojae]